MTFEQLFKQLKRITAKAMHNSKMAHDEIFGEERSEAAIVGYLSYASSLLSEARSFYFSNYDELEHYDIEEFFDQFDTFVSEVLRNISTKHSHQWSDIEFLALQEKYEQSVLSLPESES